jgi:hypothetical protein
MDKPLINGARRRNARFVPKAKIQRARFILLTGLVIALSAGSATYLWYVRDDTWNLSAPTSSAGWKAAILDELSASYQDNRFIHNVTSTLNTIGYTVDYYGPASITVGLFRDLPVKHYGIILLRVHGGSSLIYTSDHFSDTNYLAEQLTGQLERVLLDGEYYFAITSGFISHSMIGKFSGSLIVAMGCSGLEYPGLARAFVSKGARTFVGWDGSVSAGRSDDSILAMVHSLASGSSVNDAIEQAQTVSTRMDQLNLEPPYGLHLKYYDTSILPKQQLASKMLDFLVVLSIILVPLIPIAAVAAFTKLSGRR